jgi:hypothetical protein
MPVYAGEVGHAYAEFFRQRMEVVHDALNTSAGFYEASRADTDFKFTQFSLTMMATAEFEVAVAASVKAYPTLTLNWELIE